MDYLGHKKLEKNNGIYSSIDGIQEVGGLFSLNTNAYAGPVVQVFRRPWCNDSGLVVHAFR